ncbi:MAG: hypothetical protein P4N41_14015 [Negativicutes bacterium]|nr:hypothetical protein [Negativicutes bacterium]
MKKSAAILMVAVLILTAGGVCQAFPASGEYGSIERARTSDTGEIVDIPLWKLTINRSDIYSGDFVLLAKGAWIGTWTAPLSISPNQDGRYPITVTEKSWPRNQIRVDLEETNDGLVMYVNFDPVSPRFSGRVEMTKTK